MPTLFAKNFKIVLNVVIWLWYGLSIWNSPVLQYFYHQIYHNTPVDCSGEGSAAKCILLKDSSEHRHFKALKKAYLEVKLAHEKLNSSNMAATGTESSSTKAYQAIKCKLYICWLPQRLLIPYNFHNFSGIMTLKRKLKRIREGRGSEVEDDNDDSVSTEC